MDEEPNICRLCLEIIGENISFTPLQHNNAVIQNLNLICFSTIKNLQITKNPIICEQCNKKLRIFTTFKQNIINNEFKIQSNEKNRQNAFLQSISNDVDKICRLCLKISDDKNKFYTTLKERNSLIKNCKICLNANLKNPSKICQVCEEILESLAAFTDNCDEKERKLVSAASEKGILNCSDLVDIFNLKQAKKLNKTCSEGNNNLKQVGLSVKRKTKLNIGSNALKNTIERVKSNLKTQCEESHEKSSSKVKKENLKQIKITDMAHTSKTSKNTVIPGVEVKKTHRTYVKKDTTKNKVPNIRKHLKILNEIRKSLTLDTTYIDADTTDVGDVTLQSLEDYNPEINGIQELSDLLDTQTGKTSGKDNAVIIMNFQIKPSNTILDLKSDDVDDCGSDKSEVLEESVDEVEIELNIDELSKNIQDKINLNNAVEVGEKQTEKSHNTGNIRIHHQIVVKKSEEDLEQKVSKIIVQKEDVSPKIELQHEKVQEAVVQKDVVKGKRGRKRKIPLQEESSATPLTTAQKPVTKGKRGRPRKYPLPENIDKVVEVPKKGKRGRPRKYPLPENMERVENVSEEKKEYECEEKNIEITAQKVVTKGKRGRKRKIPLQESDDKVQSVDKEIPESTAQQEEVPKVPKKRGRKRKIPLPENTETPEKVTEEKDKEESKPEVTAPKQQRTETANNEAPIVQNLDVLETSQSEISPESDNVIQPNENEEVIMINEVSDFDKIDTQKEVKNEAKPFDVTIIRRKKKTVVNRAELDKTWQKLTGKVTDTEEQQESSPEAKPAVKVPKKRGPKRKPSSELKKNKLKKKVVYHQCPCCSFKTTSKLSLIQHKYIHNVLGNFSEYQCSQCQFRTSVEELFTQHMMTTHISSQLIFGCIFCDAFTSKRKHPMMNHVLLQHDDKDVANMFYCCVMNKDTSDEYFECFQCHFQSVEEAVMPDHVIDHNQDVPIKNPEVPMFRCQRCSYSTKSEEMLQRHMDIKHDTESIMIKQEEPEVELLLCDMCPYRTIHKRSLANHKNKKHPPHVKNPSTTTKPNTGKQFFCASCDYSTFRKVNIARHVLVHMTKQNVEYFECNHCYFETKHRRSFTRHMEARHRVLV